MSSTKRKRRSKQNKVVVRPLWVLVGAAIGVILFGVGGLLLSQQEGAPADFVPEVSGAPRVAVSEDRVDYGNVRLNTTIETVFRVRNVGDQPLFILGEPQVELIEGC